MIFLRSKFSRIFISYLLLVKYFSNLFPFNLFNLLQYHKKLILSATLAADLDKWLLYYNYHQTYQGKMCCKSTSIVTLLDGKWILSEKNLSSN
ncbi:hypothetical protein CFY87_07410 [Actinobacillus seminis]|uniref:Transposase n=1 Tax=Actinobacillus seminis TaxID=722 RepID=A0A263HDQ5_9PAST|nr:hypothetical protein CFY87_07410 [Actinobacillus seminis]SUU35341.1 transposase [Actinobacillus seminis]